MSDSGVDSAKQSLISQVKTYFRRACRSAILATLKRLHIGSLIIREIGHDVHEFGHRDTEPSSELVVLDDAFWPHLLFYGPMVRGRYFHITSIV